MPPIRTAFLAAAVAAGLPALAIAQLPGGDRDRSGEHGPGNDGGRPDGGRRQGGGQPGAAARPPQPAAPPAQAVPGGDRGPQGGERSGRPGFAGGPDGAGRDGRHGPDGGRPGFAGQPGGPGGSEPGRRGPGYDRGGYDRGAGYDRGQGYDRNLGGGYDRGGPRFADGPGHGGARGPAGAGWRQDRRYDWRGYRDAHREVFRVGRYVAPRGWGYGYRPFAVGVRLQPFFYAPTYWIADPYAYRLPPADGPYRWVRYYSDVLLVDLRTGEVLDAIRGFFG